jgi:hypothetical protein
MTLRETEFFLQECYKVTIDPSAIDQYMNKIKGIDPDARERERAKFHRMFQALVANEEALQAAIEYKVLADNAADSGSGYGYLKGNYGDVDWGFHIILTRFAHIFSQEDKEWWLGLVKELEEFMTVHGKEENHWNHEDYFELDAQVDPLSECFQVEFSSWNAYEHLCARKIQETN